jgi:hypothetical protein
MCQFYSDSSRFFCNQLYDVQLYCKFLSLAWSVFLSAFLIIANFSRCDVLDSCFRELILLFILI